MIFMHRLIWRTLVVLAGGVVVSLAVINSEREFRQLQAIQARQVYQKQVLLDEQSELRLELHKSVGYAVRPKAGEESQ